MVKIWHISDTHGLHEGLPIVDADIVIHSGDVSNSLSPEINSNEVLDFVGWFSQLPTQFKIFVPGNHDFSLEKFPSIKDEFKKNGINLLINEQIEINGFKFWGSPYTPRLSESYTSWGWGLNRNEMDKVWRLIPLDIDVLITHGPPKGILDLCRDYNDKKIPAQAGDQVLLNKVIEVSPIYHLFGHIHDEKSYINSCVLKKATTIFSNGSCAGGRNMQLLNYGNLLQL